MDLSSKLQSQEEWDKDIAEAQAAADGVTRPLVKTLLQDTVAALKIQKAVNKAADEREARLAAERAARLEEAAKKAADDAAAAAGAGAGLGAGAGSPAAIPATPATAVDPFTLPPSAFKGVGSVAWDQSDKKVSVYVPLDGVKASGATVKCVCTKTSMDLRIMGYNGRNLRLNQTPLSKFILPKRTITRVKKNKVVVSLFKDLSEDKYGAHWSELVGKKAPKKKPAAGLGGSSTDDPGASIMSMMKQMYDDGDADMKRTIAEAWSKSRSGGAPTPPPL